MTKLPPPRTIKQAILRMDSTIINREGIEKILTMIPSDEERTTIADAMHASPDLPLGSAENFLHTLMQVSAIEQRLRLWAFRLDFDLMEKEMGEQLMDLKKAMEEIESSQTFKIVLGTLLTMGNFLNGVDAKGFQLEYLAKVPEVKDTVNKHSLLHHLVHTIHEKFPEGTDLYSEMGAVTRASNVSYDELEKTLERLVQECKSGWAWLATISKHEPVSSPLKSKMNEFLNECNDRISVMQVVQRRVLNRFKKTLIYLGFSSSIAKEIKPQVILKIISEFALEYRTTRERVRENFEKKAKQRERNKSRKVGPEVSQLLAHKDRDYPNRHSLSLLTQQKGKESPIHCMTTMTTQDQNAKEQSELRQILVTGTDMPGSRCDKWGSQLSNKGRRACRPVNCDSEEILDSLAKTVTSPNGRDPLRKKVTTRFADKRRLRDRSREYD
jgi:hypothetical protein